MHLALHEVIDARDQLVETVATTEKLRFFTGLCQDQQLRGMIQNHAQRMEQMANRWLNELHISGQSAHIGQLPTRQFAQQTAQPNTAWNQQPTGIQNVGMDHVIAADCLKDCKGLAIKATVAATEAASPHIRQLHHQSCGEHLQMAEELYHYMEQRNWYHSPNLTQPVMQQVTQYMGQDLPTAGTHFVS